VVGIHHLEKLTGESPKTVFGSDTPAAAPTTEPAPVVPVAPVAPAPAISYDNSVMPPADSGSVNTPIDNGPMPSAPPAPSAGQAIAPDAVTPSQAGTPSEPFAIPSEPLDVPEENPAGAAPSAAPNTPPPAPPAVPQT